MRKSDLLAFVGEHMMREGEVLPRDPEWKQPFAVALVNLEAGGYEIRVAQPAVIAGLTDSNLQDVNIVGVYGPNKYSEAGCDFMYWSPNHHLREVQP